MDSSNSHAQRPEQPCAIQEFLRANPIDKLREHPYFLKIRTHSRYPHLCMFKYHQINSDFRNPIVREARGIILDASNKWAVVSYPYDKFFNAGESLAAKVDWNSAKVYEKLDGSLMTLYFYDNQWHVSSSGPPADSEFRRTASHLFGTTPRTAFIRCSTTPRPP